MMGLLASAKAAFIALPPTVETFYYRGDSASHEHELMGWLRDPDRKGGPKGCIGFGISARMSHALQKAIDAVAEDQWENLKEESERYDPARKSCLGPRTQREERQPTAPLHSHPDSEKAGTSFRCWGDGAALCGGDQY